MRITNTSEAPQGVWTASGLVYIQPGAARDIEPSQPVRVRAMAFFVIEEDEPEKPKRGRPRKDAV